ncbi:uncharacterized protein [Aquarana catesbeiana]|uniref:uncharacterized protein isoform X1 n=1 Tax=Aquarana catesbeiana TaxID=8400 RepID=UPI003CCA3FFD
MRSGLLHRRCCPLKETQQVERIPQPEPWGKAAIPSTSQTCRDLFRSVIEPNEPPVLFQSDLPGSVTDLFDEAHPSCIVKSIAIDNDSIQSQEKQGESWFDKIGIYTRKWAFLNCWKGVKEDVIELERDIHKLQNTCLNESCGPSDLAECEENDGQPYIPYQLAKMYITKVANDMQKMKIKHMQIITEIDDNAKRNREQEILILKNYYRDKMKILKARLETYYDLMEQKTGCLQEKIKVLEEEKEQWIQEKSSLLNEIQELKEKLGQEKFNRSKLEIIEIQSKKKTAFLVNKRSRDGEI